MTSIIKYTLAEPIITGPILLLLLRSPNTIANIVRQLPPSLQLTIPTLTKAISYLFGFGVLRRINNLLNRWALNNWKVDSGAKAWDWPNEVAVITGGSGGIGSELAVKLAKTGMKIAVVDLAPLPPSLQSLPNVTYFHCDITSQPTVASTAAAIKSALGPPTILINNAGIGRTYTILDVPISYLESIFHINLLSHWYTVKALLPDMIAGRKGHVVTIASMASYTAVAGMVDYCSTKAGALAFHEGLTQELRHRYDAPFIKTTSVHPYWVSTGLLSEWEDKLKSLSNPIMTPEYVAGEVAKAVLSGRSGQVVLPKGLFMNAATGARGWATWVHSLVNDTTKDVTRRMEVKKA